jgi:carbamate kinase
MAEVAKTVVVALGGNAILQPSQVGTFEEQLVNCDDSARRIARMVANGYRVILTHGNGPQVGNILIQNDAAAKLVAPMPMDVCGAESQGQIGYMLEQCLHNHLRRLKIDAPVATLLTENVVDGDDPAFANPSKPVGPFYSEGKAKELMIEQGLAMREDAGRGWRRVVPSPEPIHILQKEAIALLVRSGAVVICSGGGGIPVMRQRNGSLAGVAAVIDKDLAAARLALDVSADILLILTDVSHVYVDYRRPTQAALHRVTITEMQGYQDEGHFKAGSMGPKVEAALRFARAGGTSIIAGLLDALHALEGTSGTWIVPDSESPKAKK